MDAGQTERQRERQDDSRNDAHRKLRYFSFIFLQSLDAKLARLSTHFDLNAMKRKEWNEQSELQRPFVFCVKNRKTKRQKQKRNGGEEEEQSLGFSI